MSVPIPRPNSASLATPIDSPMNNEAEDPMAAETHASPSFDYHEERRLHLKDEIWLSHHLPRLPPPSITDVSSSLGNSPSSSFLIENHLKNSRSNPNLEAGLKQTRAVPGDINVSGSSPLDPSPSAFHPKPAGQRKHDGHIDLGKNLQSGGAGMWMDGADGSKSDPQNSEYPGSGMVSPSGPDSGDLDPRGSMVHREELDDQERLDLAEEARERGLSEAADLVGKLNLGSQRHEAERPSAHVEQVAQQPSELHPEPDHALWLIEPVDAGISSELEALYASFAKCLSLRDKYMELSNQRLGDNPRDHDGSFKGFFPRSAGDITGLKPTSDQETCEEPSEEPSSESELPPWKIYPAPPPPHWHWKPAEDGIKPEQHSESSKTTGLGGPGSGASGGADNSGYDFVLNDEGVYEVWSGGSTSEDRTKGKGKEKLSRVADLREYFSDLDYLLGVCSDGPAKSFAFRRLKYLTSKWSLYCLLNEYQELADMKAVPHRDFYNVRKVDTHIHHSASMNQKHLLRFIKSKLKKNPDEIVIHRDGADLTLQQVFDSLKLTAYDLSIDTLDMHAHQEFHRFDRFNDRYNPTGSSRLREIFLKTDNLLKGKYLAELTQELIADLEQSKYQVSEWRLSIYGRNVNEWDKLAKWVINHKLLSHNVRWLIQVPRLYELYKKTGQVETFEDVVRNVFQPLFEVTKDPSSHPELHVFLQRVVGFDSVDDESKPERRLYRKFPTAKMWNTRQSPPYSYWIYYMYANMSSLNAWRRTKGFSESIIKSFVDRVDTFVLRPHCGEAGDPDHLSSAFLTAHSISHGILLRKVPALQYLFYLKQIGLAMSPLSNNALFLTYERNPFKDFFRTGLNVSLSTDDPLQFHFTASHLLEEYSCAAQIYKLTPADMCELARNSVIQSGWEMQTKKHWIGNKWYMPGAAGNDIHKTNVPNIRLAYRHATLLEELQLIHYGGTSSTGTRQSTPRSPAVPTARVPPLSDDRPGMPSRPSDLGAAAMGGSGSTASTAYVAHGALMAGAAILDEKAQKRKSTSALTEKLHEARR